MTYREMSTVPAYETLNREAGIDKPRNGALLWGSTDAPPAIGARIIVTINNCGPAIVTGYFEQDGYLGVLCDLLDAPEWHVKQNKGNPRGHVFGPEFRHDYTAADYEAERAICDKAAAYAERIMSNGGTKRARNYLSAEEAQHPDYAACDNAMRGRVERFEILRDKPARLYAYLSSDSRAITLWTGDKLGRAAATPYRTPGGKDRVRIAATVDGVPYKGFGDGPGMFCNLARA